MPARAPAPPKFRLAWIYLGLALLTLAVFAPVIGFSFLDYDDEVYVTTNPHVLGGLTWSSIRWAFLNAAASNWHPLTWLSHMLDCQLYGLRPGWHHLTNLLFHTANALLLLRCLHKMTGAVWRSTVVAALFAVHPLHVESVAWVAERKDVLSTCFGLLSLLAYVRYVEHSTRLVTAAPGPKPKPNQRSGAGARQNEVQARATWPGWSYLGSLLLFAASLAAKPMLVTLPFLLLLLDYWPLCRMGARLAADRGRVCERGYGPGSGWRIIAEKLPFLALTLGSCCVTIYAQKQGGALLSLEKFPLGLRLANALVSYVRYLSQTVWPQRLAAFYPHPVHWPGWQVAGAGLLLVTFSLAVLWSARRRPHLVTGWFWYVGTLVPVIGLVQVGSQAMADRYMYWPAVGVFIALTWGVSDLMPSRPPGLLGGALLAVAACAVWSGVQVRYWKDSETLFRHAVQVTRNNCIAYNNLGTALVQQERLDEAIQAFSEALRIRPDFAETHANLGGALRKRGDLQAAAAHFDVALQLRPDDAQVQNDLGNVLDNLGHPEAAVPHYEAALRLQPALAGTEYNLAGSLAALGRTDEAIAHYRAALRLDPKNASAHFNLGYTLARAGRLTEAEAEYLEALRLNPNHVGAQNNLGNLLVRLGKPQAAILHFAAVLELDPKAAEAHYSLGRVLVGQGQPDAALPHLREAARLKPNWVPALHDLVWLLATCPRAEVRDPVQAVELGEKLCALTHNQQPTALAALAAAYAEAGEFTKAISTAEGAQSLAMAGRQPELTADLGKQLELYRSGRPWHEAPPPTQ